MELLASKSANKKLNGIILEFIQMDKGADTDEKTC